MQIYILDIYILDIYILVNTGGKGLLYKRHKKINIKTTVKQGNLKKRVITASQFPLRSLCVCVPHSDLL